MNTFKLYLYHLVTLVLPESRCFGLKNALLRWAGAKIGANVRIYSSAKILGTGALEIGDDVHIGAGARISPVAPSSITLGSHIDIGPEVMIITGTHEIDPSGEHIGGKGKSASVTIGSGSWLGARATILSGVTLPSKTLVAAGSVVTKSFDVPCSLIAGVPASLKKAFDSGK